MIDVDSFGTTTSFHHSEHESFRDWRSHVRAQGLLPVIGVTGSRGKSSVVRLLDAMFVEAGLRTATRTDSFVEIRRKRQRGEIAPWRRVRDELTRGTLDVAIEEIDWLTVQTMGIPRESYPAFVVTNVCGNRDACLIQGDARRAAMALPIIFEGTTRDGNLILTGDELIVSREESAHPRPTTFVGLSKEGPGLRGHLEDGGASAWVDHGMLIVGRSSSPHEVCKVADIPSALAGRAGFLVHNALMAAATAITIGVPVVAVKQALRAYHIEPARTPGSFHIVDVDGISVVLDRPNPSWFLRPVLRTLRDVNPSRVITVVGKLGAVPQSDIQEVGRLLGRVSSIFVTHSIDDSPELAAAVKQGVALNEIPPMIVHVKAENRALSRALSMAHRGDLIFMLSDKPEHYSRLLSRGDSYFVPTQPSPLSA